jgi:hypothetical protein
MKFATSTRSTRNSTNGRNRVAEFARRTLACLFHIPIIRRCISSPTPHTLPLFGTRRMMSYSLFTHSILTLVEARHLKLSIQRNFTALYLYFAFSATVAFFVFACSKTFLLLLLLVVSTAPCSTNWLSTLHSLLLKQTSLDLPKAI